MDASIKINIDVLILILRTVDESLVRVTIGRSRNSRRMTFTKILSNTAVVQSCAKQRGFNAYQRTQR